MHRELTITIAENVYERLHQAMDETETSRFIEALARPHVLGAPNLEGGVIDLIAMPEDCDISFEPSRLDTDSYRKSEAV